MDPRALTAWCFAPPCTDLVTYHFASGESAGLSTAALGQTSDFEEKIGSRVTSLECRFFLEDRHSDLATAGDGLSYSYRSDRWLVGQLPQECVRPFHPLRARFACTAAAERLLGKSQPKRRRVERTPKLKPPSSANLSWVPAMQCPRRTSNARHVATLAGLQARRDDYGTTGENHRTASGYIPAPYK